MFGVKETHNGRKVKQGGIVAYSRRVIMNHRYLRDHGLPHSSTAADIFIGTVASRSRLDALDILFASKGKPERSFSTRAR